MWLKGTCYEWLRMTKDSLCSYHLGLSDGFRSSVKSNIYFLLQITTSHYRDDRNKWGVEGGVGDEFSLGYVTYKVIIGHLKWYV